MAVFIAVSPENTIVGKAIVMTEAFAAVSLDIVTSSDIVVVRGNWKQIRCKSVLAISTQHLKFVTIIIITF